jgi:hypothetical protein
MSFVKDKAKDFVGIEAMRERAVQAGKPPRRPGQHYFIETEGLHSRIHLQNFYSTLWPQIEDPAVASIDVYDKTGQRAPRTHTVEIPRFGSLFLEARELLSLVGSSASEGIVTIDVSPPAGVLAELHDLPKPEQAELASPFWMAYYDDNESFMYVHAIDKMAGRIEGTTRVLDWRLERVKPQGGKWRSWRLLDLENLTEVQVVLCNHKGQAGSSTVGVYSPDDSVVLFEQTVDIPARGLERVKISGDALREAVSGADVEHVRIGANPLLTPNGKPYVLMRYYGDGPLSLHHG